MKTYSIKRLFLIFATSLLLVSMSTAAAENVMDKTIFEKLNLNYPGLGEVKKLYEQKKYDDAAEVLLSYFRHRKKVQNPEVSLQNIRVSKEELKWANEALEHRFFAHKGYQPSYFYGKDIDWTYWPVHDNELRWQLHRLKWFIPMGKVYRSTGDEKYAKEWTIEYLDWIKKNPLVELKKSGLKTISSGEAENLKMTKAEENMGFAWRQLEVSNRLQDQHAYFMYFNTSKYFTSKFFTFFLANVYRHANFLTHHYSAQGNHLLFEAQRMLYAGILFPEFKDASAWRKSAIDILNKQIGVQVYADGMQFELDPHYHLAAIEIFCKALRMASVNGLRNEFPDFYTHTVEKMIEAAWNLMFPDYTTPMFSDAKLHGKTEMLQKFKTWSQLFPSNQTIHYFASEGKAGKLPAYNSHALSKSGFYIFRNGWTPLSTEMIIKAGPPAFWHCQPDNGTFELYIKGRNFFPDTGSYIYAGDSSVMKWRNWFRQTMVHNTLTLNNMNYEKTNSGCMWWQVNKPIESLVVENQAYSGLTHRRTVFFVHKKFFVIVDEAKGKATGTVGVHFQLCEGNVKLDIANKMASTGFSDANNVLVKCFSSNPDAVMHEEEGWVSYQYKQKNKRKAFTINVDKKDQQTVRTISVILPVSDATKSPQITAHFEKVSPDGKSLNLQVTIGAQKYELGYKI